MMRVQKIHLARLMVLSVFLTTACSSYAQMCGLCGDERAYCTPECHPTWGYHRECWRQFPPTQPCYGWGDYCAAAATDGWKPCNDCPCASGQCGMGQCANGQCGLMQTNGTIGGSTGSTTPIPTQGLGALIIQNNATQPNANSFAPSTVPAAPTQQQLAPSTNSPGVGAPIPMTVPGNPSQMGLPMNPVPMDEGQLPPHSQTSALQGSANFRRASFSGTGYPVQNSFGNQPVYANTQPQTHTSTTMTMPDQSSVPAGFQPTMSTRISNGLASLRRALRIPGGEPATQTYSQPFPAHTYESQPGPVKPSFWSRVKPW